MKSILGEANLVPPFRCMEDNDETEYILDEEAVKSVAASNDNEATEIPYWVIIDPKHQLLTLDTNRCFYWFTGPFFSRESAQAHLERTKHNHTDKARVWCLSGHESEKYTALYRASAALKEKTNG